MRIAFLGDLAFLGQFDKINNDLAEKNCLFLKKELEKYDYVVANLESPLTDRHHTLVCKSMHLKSSTCNAELLKFLNVSAVSLANNHIMDYGYGGAYDTIKILERENINWFGLDNRDHRIDIEGQRVSFSGFCCYSTNGTYYGRDKGINTLTYNNVEQQLKKDKKDNYFSCLSLHWGMEHTNYPAYEHIQMIHQLLSDNDAIVAGHHPHVIQGIESYRNSLIAYSLGNAVFDTCISRNGKLRVDLNEDNRKGFIFVVDLQNNSIKDFSVVGFYISENGIQEYNIKPYLEEISNKILDINSVEEYEKMRLEQFHKVIENKFGKHDLRWVMSRLNYYAIGAKIMGKMRQKKYRKEMAKFIHG